MANKLYNDTSVKAIADAIRAKNGTTNTYTVGEMASAITNLPSGSGDISNITWHQCPEAPRNFVNNVTYDPNDYSTSQIENYAPEPAEQSNTKPIGKTVDGVKYYNQVPNVKTPFASTNAAGTLKPLDQLRWLNTTSITWVDGVNAFSSVEAAEAYIASHPDTPDRTLFRIYPVEPPGTVPNNREFMIYEDGTLKLFSYYDVGYNVRDLGGWNCDGGTVQYGMLVRGGDTNPADKHLMVDEIGIRTEVRLFEQSAQGLDHSVWDIDMIVNPTNSVIAYSMDKAMWKPLLIGIFDSVSHNKPVYFHCGQGADRTGAMAVMLEAILGVSESDISKEYELTSFSGALRKRNSTEFQTIINNIKNVSLVGGLTDTFRNHAISFALSCGIKIDEINDFRKACINGNPEQISVTLNPYSITKSGDTTNVIYSNTASEVEPYQEYETELYVPYGMTITGVTITMGGSDITDTAFTGTESAPTIKKYTVTKTLSESTINNQKTEVIENEGYGATITPNANNHITGITVMMGGIDVSSSVVTLI